MLSMLIEEETSWLACETGWVVGWHALLLLLLLYCGSTLDTVSVLGMFCFAGLN